MLIKNLRKQKQSILNGDFDLIYSPEIMALSNQHWTPTDVIKESINFLCMKENSQIIDVGSGVGKFCISGAVLKPKCLFYGVEYREKFVDLSIKIKDDYRIDNAHFINDDFSAIDFNHFNGVYFFNSFQENIDGNAAMDELSQISYNIYWRHNQNLALKLKNMPEGTRLVTYQTKDIFIPSTYNIVETGFDNKLKFYIKNNEVSKNTSMYEN